MNFENLNALNVTVNKLSGNFLPVTRKKAALPVLWKSYSILVWLIELSYLTACLFGIFNAPRDRALKDSTVNIVVSLEAVLLIVRLHSRRNLLRKLIGKLNSILAADDPMLRNITIETVKPLEKPLKIYTIATLISLALWISIPVAKVFRKEEFYYTDYRVPAAISKQPFSVDVFIVGILLQIFGSAYTVLRKIGLDIYTMHLILLLTAQYKYLRIKFAAILGQESNVQENRSKADRWQCTSCDTENLIEIEIRALAARYRTVLEMGVMLQKLLSPNIGILYVNNVFRFCFLSFMFVMSSTVYFEKCLIVLYTLGALTQFYILCFCIQGLLEASKSVADDAFHENWCFHYAPVRRTIVMLVLANKLECRLSSVRNIDLTLPSFMSILNQAYSVCLLLLKVRRD